MKILIIRHGDPDYAADSLTEKGWREAEYPNHTPALHLPPEKAVPHTICHTDKASHLSLPVSEYFLWEIFHIYMQKKSHQPLLLDFVKPLKVRFRYILMK